jgi:predicted DNA-binding transcriptional regulator YafY
MDMFASIAPIDLRIRVRQGSVRFFQERKFHASQTFEGQADDGSAEYTYHVVPGVDVERFLLSWADEIEVLEPQQMQEKIKERQRRAGG